EEQPFRPFTKQSLERIVRRQEEGTFLGQALSAHASAFGAAHTHANAATPLAGRVCKHGLNETGEAADEAKHSPTKPTTTTSDERRPNPKLAAGMKLPPALSDKFSAKRLGGALLEDIDDYYGDKFTFVVVSRDKTIFRFSATNALFLLSPFNPIRRVAIRILTHPAFSMLVLLAIICNCVFMAQNSSSEAVEYTFTAIYTTEATIKAISRGLILTEFTYLRDAWNWLDFIVIGLAYIMFFVPTLGNLSALRSLRVLRALKTVTTVPGLKTIVGALMEAVKRLRDVGILTIFVLSIFALVGLQVYKGTLLQKCVSKFNFTEYLDYEYMGNASELTSDELKDLKDQVRKIHHNNESNWLGYPDELRVCSLNSDLGQQCPEGFECFRTDKVNPNFGYTNFDNFGWSMLCAFRLMTQDAWESLYQLIIRTNGTPHVVFFVLVIMMGSFFLINVILAIVAMAYDEVRKQDKLDEEEEEAARKQEDERREQEEQVKEASIEKSFSDEVSCLSITDIYKAAGIPLESAKKSLDKLSIRSDKIEGGPVRTPISSYISKHFLKHKSKSVSLPGSPCIKHKDRFHWKPSDCTQVNVLETISFPYADDSAAHTPASDASAREQRDSFNSKFKYFALFSAFANRQPTKTDLLGKIANSKSPLESRKYKDILMCTRNGSDKPIPEILLQEETKQPGVLDHKELLGIRKTQSQRTLRETTSQPPAGQEVEMNDVVVLKTLIEDAATTKPEKEEVECRPKEKKFEHYKHLFLEKFCYSWECCYCWKVLEKYVSYFILDPFVELFITLCILVNTACMALDVPSNTPTFKEILSNANLFFTATFGIEAVCKLIAMKPQVYFKDGWNIFDFTIVVLSFVELTLQNVQGLSILRAFRLLRVFKLAKSWQTMNLLFAIIARTMGALGNLVFVLGIIIFIFAVVGMQLFGENYALYKNETLYPEFKGDYPRWNFKDFTHSFMIVFRVLCGEWIESMWGCINVNGYICVPFFLLTNILASLVVLSLFLALLLSSFGAESLQRREEEEEVNKLQEAIDRINRFIVWSRIHIKRLFWYLVGKACTRSYNDNDLFESDDADDSSEDKAKPASGKDRISIQLDSRFPLKQHGTYIMENVTIAASQMVFKDINEASILSDAAGANQNKVFPAGHFAIAIEDKLSPKFDEEPEINEVDIQYWDAPEDCLPKQLMDFCPRAVQLCDNTNLGKIWWGFRCRAHTSWLNTILEYMDKCFTIIFTFEMVVKWFAFGLKKYFKDAWCWLDFVIVNVALFSLVLNLVGGASGQNMGAFKAMRTLRALRPLRAVSRWEGMKVVVNALIQAIPSIFNVLLVCLVFWLIFSIMGVQLFGGQFYKCVDSNNERVSADLVPNKEACEAMAAAFHNVSWENSRINFDNFLNGYLALFQIATYKGWIPIIADAVDITGPNNQPIRDASTSMYLFFVLFIIFGSFFTLKLFIGVIIDNFNRAGGSVELFMTEDQKRYYKAMKKMSSTAPQKPVPKPKLRIPQFFFKVINDQKFDIAIMVFIMLNTIVMCIEHHNQSEAFNDAVEQINRFFIVIFTGECVMKLLAQRWYYFKFAWNMFDFVIVVLSILTWAIEDIMVRLPIPPTMIRVVRVFRVGRVLRLVKSARGIRTLLFSLFVSLPALFNIGLLLFMIMFIYSIVGISFFSHVRHRSGIDEIFNFETFPSGMVVLFQLSTSAGWDSVLDGLINEEEPDCNPNKKPHSDCGNYAIAVVFLISYLVISFLVIINMYIAVILENFSQATEDVQQGLTQEDFD
uniref:Sodium channel protein n=1 Tax=Macrostomum lignano TaxID=282301 RepID=A0A1I8HQ99_9PLAT